MSKHFPAAFSWKALDDLFTSSPEALGLCVQEPTGREFAVRVLNRSAAESLEHVYEDFEALQHLAYAVTEELEDDFARMALTVKNATRILREAFSPEDARKLILAYEESKAPELSPSEIIIGTYLVLKTGERDIPGFDVLDALISVEMPA